VVLPGTNVRFSDGVRGHQGVLAARFGAVGLHDAAVDLHRTSTSCFMDLRPRMPIQLQLAYALGVGSGLLSFGRMPVQVRAAWCISRASCRALQVVPAKMSAAPAQVQGPVSSSKMNHAIAAANGSRANSTGETSDASALP